MLHRLEVVTPEPPLLAFSVDHRQRPAPAPPARAGRPADGGRTGVDDAERGEEARGERASRRLGPGDLPRGGDAVQRRGRRQHHPGDAVGPACESENCSGSRSQTSTSCGTIRVERQRNQTGSLSRPKSRAARRTVPVGQVVIDTLAAHLAACPSEGALFVDESASRCSTGAGARLEALRGLRADLRGRLGEAGPEVARTTRPRSSPLQTCSHLWPGDDDRTRGVMDAALSGLADYARTKEAEMRSLQVRRTAPARPPSSPSCRPGPSRNDATSVTSATER